MTHDRPDEVRDRCRLRRGGSNRERDQRERRRVEGEAPHIARGRATGFFLRFPFSSSCAWRTEGRRARRRATTRGRARIDTLPRRCAYRYIARLGADADVVRRWSTRDARAPEWPIFVSRGPRFSRRFSAVSSRPGRQKLARPDDEKRNARLGGEAGGEDVTRNAVQVPRPRPRDPRRV